MVLTKYSLKGARDPNNILISLLEGKKELAEIGRNTLPYTRYRRLYECTEDHYGNGSAKGEDNYVTVFTWKRGSEEGITSLVSRLKTRFGVPLSDTPEIDKDDERGELTIRSGDHWALVVLDKDRKGALLVTSTYEGDMTNEFKLTAMDVGGDLVLWLKKTRSFTLVKTPRPKCPVCGGKLFLKGRAQGRSGDYVKVKREWRGPLLKLMDDGAVLEVPAESSNEEGTNYDINWDKLFDLWQHAIEKRLGYPPFTDWKGLRKVMEVHRSVLFDFTRLDYLLDDGDELLAVSVAGVVNICLYYATMALLTTLGPDLDAHLPINRESTVRNGRHLFIELFARSHGIPVPEIAEKESTFFEGMETTVRERIEKLHQEGKADEKELLYLLMYNVPPLFSTEVLIHKRKRELEIYSREEAPEMAQMVEHVLAMTSDGELYSYFIHPHLREDYKQAPHTFALFLQHGLTPFKPIDSSSRERDTSTLTSDDLSLLCDKFSSRDEDESAVKRSLFQNTVDAYREDVNMGTVLDWYRTIDKIRALFH